MCRMYNYQLRSNKLRSALIGHSIERTRQNRRMKLIFCPLDGLPRLCQIIEFFVCFLSRTRSVEILNAGVITCSRVPRLSLRVWDVTSRKQRATRLTELVNYVATCQKADSRRAGIPIQG